MVRPGKKLYLLEIVLIGLLFINLIYLAKIYKLQKPNNKIIDLDKLKSLSVWSPDGFPFKISEIINSQEICILFFKLTDCPPCIHRGLEQAKTLMNKERNVFFITIHDWFDEWKAWLKNLESNNFFITNKQDAEQAINLPYTPALVVIKNNKITYIKYITN
ncbi:MAG: hypothetical protein QME85_11300 [Candidatus Saccharicenans sp.]|nr:hypothetical protein [Candidatus Saccharicenans sp.]